MLLKAADTIRRCLRPSGLEAFIHRLKSGARVLDVGCGNNSPFKVKGQRPDLRYFGLDVQDYNQGRDPNSVSEVYRIVPPSHFVPAIAGMGGQFDAVLSRHNIEHCDSPSEVLGAMIDVLAPGGMLFLTWPSAHSVSLPSRGGCLNFYDDPEHKLPLAYDTMAEACERNGCRIMFGTAVYRPAVTAVLGAILEPISAWRNQVLPYRLTWDFYGFESVLWIQRPA